MKSLRLKPGMSLFACAACALGLLLWARLLLVSHPPRVATADPVPAANADGDADHGDVPNNDLPIDEPKSPDEAAAR